MSARLCCSVSKVVLQVDALHKAREQPAPVLSPLRSGQQDINTELVHQHEETLAKLEAIQGKVPSVRC